MAGRPLPEEFSLIEAKQHIDAAKSLIQKYIGVEPGPAPFGLGVLEALLREVDSLDDQLEAMVAVYVVAPEVDSSTFIIAWIVRASIVKQGLDDLVQVLKPIIYLFD